MAEIIRKKSAQDAVYSVLKEGIMTLNLPPGTEMSTQEMATRLNVSRTPVREAFIRLQNESLLDIVPQKGTIVSRINLNRVKQERFIRESLELAVIDRFMKNCRPDHYSRLRDCVDLQRSCLEDVQAAKFIQYDNQMHRLFFEIAEQTLAWDTLNSVSGHDERFRVLAVQNRDIMENAILQHEYMLVLMEQGSLEEARSEMYNHVRKVNYEKSELTRRYPDYFTTGESADTFPIGSL